MPKSWQGIAATGLLAAVGSMAGLSTAAEGDDKTAQIKQRVSSAIKAWADVNSVGVTEDVTKGLSDQAIVALDDITKRNTGLSRQRLEGVAPRAAVEYLKRSANSGKTPAMADLMEQLATGSGALLPAVSDFPTLKIEVKPPEPKDFVVSIDGREFPGGRSSFRIAATEKSVTVSRAGKLVCSFKVRLAPGAVHTQGCAAKS